jgi:hypothetical protein
MIIRQASQQEWPLIYRCCAVIVTEGKTHPFPERQTPEEGRPWWMKQPQARRWWRTQDQRKNRDVTLQLAAKKEVQLRSC